MNRYNDYKCRLQLPWLKLQVFFRKVEPQTLKVQSVGHGSHQHLHAKVLQTLKQRFLEQVSIRNAEAVQRILNSTRSSCRRSSSSSSSSSSGSGGSQGGVVVAVVVEVEEVVVVIVVVVIVVGGCSSGGGGGGGGRGSFCSLHIIPTTMASAAMRRIAPSWPLFRC